MSDAVIERAADAPGRGLGHPERWTGPDGGLIWCWERGRAKAAEDPELAAKCAAGELPPLAWAGGVENASVTKKAKGGTLQYLATWRGLRGEALRIDPAGLEEVVCARTGQAVRFGREWRKVK